MAYIDFSELQPESRTREAAPAPEPVSAFSALEWSVIALAQRDRLASLRRPGRIATALGSLFGAWQNPRLADSRLEALRRIAVLAWHKSYAVPVSELRAFLAAGFSAEHYEMLQASISRGRSQKRRQSA